jgi:hypothetical protein
MIGLPPRNSREHDANVPTLGGRLLSISTPFGVGRRARREVKEINKANLKWTPRNNTR